eukprot:6257059-Amphidinium_carterae.1
MEHASSRCIGESRLLNVRHLCPQDVATTNFVSGTSIASSPSQCICLAGRTWVTLMQSGVLALVLWRFELQTERCIAAL